MTLAEFRAKVSDLDAQVQRTGPNARQWADVLFWLADLVEAPPIIVAAPPRQMTAEECAAAGPTVVPFAPRAA